MEKHLEPEIQPAQEAQPARGSISVCIVARNEADRLADCLSSVGWADEILVMDLESMDDSARIAQQAGARVISRPPHPIVEPLRSELADQASGEWILALDPDETITPGLAEQLQRIAQLSQYDLVVIPRMNVDFAYPPSNAYHRYEPQARMYRRSAVRWPAEPHELPVVPEERKYYLPHRDEFVMVHNRNRDIPEALERAIRYAPAEARAMIEQGQTFTFRDMAASLGRAIDRQFFLAQPWRDGVPGLLRAATLVGYKFYVWASFWQYSGAERRPADDRLVHRLWLLGRLLRLLLRPLLRPLLRRLLR
jgi:glycosyltransferase involved in cell wall biosynthesis